MPSFPATVVFSGFLLLHSLHSGAAAQEISFAREILPILSDKCFVCHGPDGTDRDVVQLDTPEQATLLRDNGRAIDRDHPGQSSTASASQRRTNSGPLPPRHHWTEPTPTAQLPKP